jgi:hypothetical protein
MEGVKQSCTPYQRFDFVSAWQRNVGEREGLSPFIVIAYDAERRPLMLLPLAVRHVYGARCASFMGGKHSTFNMALWDKEFAATATRADLDRLIAALSERHEADVLALHQQPLRWRDLPNPMALLPHQPSANDCPLLRMAPGAAPTALVSKILPAAPQGQGTQAAAGSRLSLSCRGYGNRCYAPARLVLSHQAAADGRAKTAKRVRGSRCRGFHPQCLRRAGCRRQPRHRYPRARMRRGSDRDLRRRRRRPSLSMMFNTYTMSASSKYSPA